MQNSKRKKTQDSCVLIYATIEYYPILNTLCIEMKLEFNLSFDLTIYLYCETLQFWDGIALFSKKILVKLNLTEFFLQCCGILYDMNILYTKLFCLLQLAILVILFLQLFVSRARHNLSHRIWNI